MNNELLNVFCQVQFTNVQFLIVIFMSTQILWIYTNLQLSKRSSIRQPIILAPMPSPPLWVLCHPCHPSIILCHCESANYLMENPNDSTSGVNEDEELAVRSEMSPTNIVILHPLPLPRGWSAMLFTHTLVLPLILPHCLLWRVERKRRAED